MSHRTDQLILLTRVVTNTMCQPPHYLYHQYLVQDTIISCLDYCNSILIVHPISTLVWQLPDLHMASRVIFVKIIHFFKISQWFPIILRKDFRSLLWPIGA